MMAAQPIYEFTAPPQMAEWELSSLIKWRRARSQYEERIRERCQWTGEKVENLTAGVRSTVKPELLEFLAEYEFAKAKGDITDGEILEKVQLLCAAANYDHIANPEALFSKKLKMDMSVKDVHSRVSKYFMLFNRLVEDNGLVDILGKCPRSSPDFTTQTKKRTKILIANLMPPMLHEKIHGMAEYKFKYVRTDEQVL